MQRDDVTEERQRLVTTETALAVEQGTRRHQLASLASYDSVAFLHFLRPANDTLFCSISPTICARLNIHSETGGICWSQRYQVPTITAASTSSVDATAPKIPPSSQMLSTAASWRRCCPAAEASETRRQSSPISSVVRQSSASPGCQSRNLLPSLIVLVTHTSVVTPQRMMFRIPRLSKSSFKSVC